MYPRLVIDKNKILENTRALVDLCHTSGITVMGVTKVVCAYPEVVDAFVEGGVDYLADSRMENLEGLGHYDLPRVLLRLPMIHEANRVVANAEISLNSEVETIKALGAAAKALGKPHKIVLMVDLGDLREGVLLEEVKPVVKEIITIEGISLHGLGVNLTCYGGVIPTSNHFEQLLGLKSELEDEYGITIEMISGGNSSSLYLLEKGQVPAGINNLRLGESIVLGRETAYGKVFRGLHQDAFLLEAALIEVKDKPSLPIGNIGMNAFGQVPSFEDKGIRKRGILAIGKQDVYYENLIPLDESVTFFGTSSDHLLVDITDTDYRVGDIMGFTLEYGAMLSLFTSAYVHKTTI